MGHAHHAHCVGMALEWNQIHYDWKLLYGLALTQWKLTRVPLFCFALQFILIMKSLGTIWGLYLFIEDLVYSVTCVTLHFHLRVAFELVGGDVLG